MIAFTRDQEDFRKSVARFVDAEVAPAAQALDAGWRCAIPRSTAAPTPT